VKLTVNYSQMERSEHLEDFIRKEMEHTCTKIDRNRSQEFDVYLKCENSKVHSGTPSYQVTVELTGQGHPYVVKKHSDDIYAGIKEARHALETQIRRHH